MMKEGNLLMKTGFYERSGSMWNMIILLLIVLHQQESESEANRWRQRTMLIVTSADVFISEFVETLAEVCTSGFQ